MATPPRDAVVRKGRGATFDPDNRFAPARVEAVDDGWWQEAAMETAGCRTELMRPVDGACR